MSLCLYVIMALCCLEFSLIDSFDLEATEMATETTRGILYYYPRGAEARRGVCGQLPARREVETRLPNFIVVPKPTPLIIIEKSSHFHHFPYLIAEHIGENLEGLQHIRSI